MELNWGDGEGAVDVSPGGEMVILGLENRVRVAFEAGKEIGAEVVDGADEVLVVGEVLGQEHAEDGGADPGADEAFDRLLGRDLDELGAAEGDTAHVGHDIVGRD